MLKTILFILLAIVLGWTVFRRYVRQTSGIDSMNVYRLHMGKAKVFTKLKKFIAIHGLPQNVSLKGITTPVNTYDDLQAAITEARENRHELFLNYEGFCMNYFHDGRLVIWNIDFRKATEGLTYNGIVFDNQFTFSQFEALFPHSSNTSISSFGIQTLFELNTKDWLPNAESYMVERWSKDNIFAHPTVEFTFLDGRLIYIFFANF